MFCLYCNTQYRAYFLNLKRFDIRKDLPEKIVKAFEIVATGPDVTAFNIARARDSFTVSRETDAQATSNKSRRYHPRAYSRVRTS